MKQAQNNIETIKEIAAVLLTQPVRFVELLSGGRNSSVYRVFRTDGTSVILKQYSAPSEGQRNRMDTEFNALQFLVKNGITSVPAPLSFDAARNAAVYELVEGRRVAFDELQERDIGAAVDLLYSLKMLCRNAGSSVFSPAAEACFSLNAVFENIQQRLERLLAVGNDTPAHEQLKAFLEERFIPARTEIIGWCVATAEQKKIAAGDDIPQSDRTLSPSDFGFHNALRKKDGSLVFLDFEYFGWDDPAKMISDFLLHPGMEIDLRLKKQFYAGIIQKFEDTRRLPERVMLVYPLFGLKWCMILLNEFIAAHMSRRQFAGAVREGKDELLYKQLGKAETMLKKICHEYRRFPFNE